MHCSVISDEVNSFAAECMSFLYFQLLLLDESRDKDVIYSLFVIIST